MTTATAPRPATSPPAAGRRPRRIQRFVVGMAMSIVAFVLERIVSRAMRRSDRGR